ncbi:MAG: pyrimidine 5'-nucleotidase [Robiginitomaculum sp.]
MSFDRLAPARRGEINCWIFDLDNTLYRADVAFFSQIDRKMTQFISRYLALGHDEARLLQKQYLVEYGTSLSGLMAVNGMDPAEFLDFVHDVDVSMLAPNPDLRRAIDALPGRKFIYTNGSRGHAKNVATHLNLFDLFDGSFGIEDSHYTPKPKRAAYDMFCESYNIEPRRAMFFEDSARNLLAPHAMGMATLLVTSDMDWGHEPEAVRPQAQSAEPHIDVVTSDLTRWLTSRCG